MGILDKIKSVIGLDEVDKFRTAGAEQKENTKAFQKSEAWLNRKEEARQVAQMGDGHRSLYYQKTFASKGQKSLDELKVAVDIWQERGDSASTAIAAHTLDTTAEEGIEKQLKQLEEKHENLGEDLVALANAVLELAIKTGVAKTDSVLEGKKVNDLIILCEKMEDAAVKHELVEVMKEGKETALDSRVQKLLEMSPEERERVVIVGSRTDVLIEQLTQAECGLHAATLLDLKDDEKYTKGWERDKTHAEHGLNNIARGKTLESEVADVLKMKPQAKKEYYQEVRKSGGQKAVDELTSAVKKQRTKSNALEM